MYSDFVKSIIVKMYALIYNAILELDNEGVSKDEVVKKCIKDLDKKYIFQPFIPQPLWLVFDEFILHLTQEIRMSYKMLKIDGLAAILETEVGNWGIDVLRPIVFEVDFQKKKKSCPIIEIEDITKLASYTNFEIDTISEYDDDMDIFPNIWEDDVCLQSDIKYCKIMGV